MDIVEPEQDGEEPITKKRRVMMPFVVVNEETGEIVDPATRKSSREATVRSKHELQNKLKDAQQRRVRLDLLPLARSSHDFSAGRLT